jgi:hypothetical protein
MRKSTGTRLVILAIILQFLPLSAPLPSAFEDDRSREDLDELESMLSGEHRGSSYGPGETDVYRSSLPTQAFPGPAYDPPYRNIFQNDTYFGDFIRQLDGSLPPKDNQTWSEVLLNGTLYLNVSGKKTEKSSTHFIKPILIEEPDF